MLDISALERFYGQKEPPFTQHSTVGKQSDVYTLEKKGEQFRLGPRVTVEYKSWMNTRCTFIAARFGDKDFIIKPMARDHAARSNSSSNSSSPWY